MAWRDTSLKLQHVKFPGVSRNLLCDLSLKQPRIMVPGDWRRQILRTVHGLVHPSGKATSAVLSRSYVWPNIRKDILGWARSCHLCARNKVARHITPAIEPVGAPGVRFEHVHLDLVGPFPSNAGYKHVLTAIDRMTHWPEAFPYKGYKG